MRVRKTQEKMHLKNGFWTESMVNGVRHALMAGAALFVSMSMLTAGTALAVDSSDPVSTGNMNIATSPESQQQSTHENNGLDETNAKDLANNGVAGESSGENAPSNMDGNDGTDGGAAQGGTVSNQTMSNMESTLKEGGDTSMDNASIVPFSVNPNDLQEHEIQTVSPRGTTINLFDYWRERQGEDDTTMPGGESYEQDIHHNENAQPWDFDNLDAWWNLGINNGKTLKFGNDMKDNLPKDYCNPEATSGDTVCSSGEHEWLEANLGGSRPREGIVSGILGDDGYPYLSGNGMVGSHQESLDYLFSPDNGNYKKAYKNVKNLLKVTNDGYYEFDAKDNYAAFDEPSTSFKVYDTPAITNQSEEYREKRLGQFFPFNNASQVFDENDGKLVYEYSKKEADETDNSLYSNSKDLNHFFGLTMTTQFIQQYNGHVNDEADSAPVTYNFSGDDDVWVYIDGLLVGDLGGVHSAVALDIDFSTGAVIVYIDENGDNDYNEGDVSIKETTIRAAMTKSAGNNSEKQEEIKNLFGPENGDMKDTLKNDTTHTLQFFYLERGNTDSNMSLKFNLATIPASSVLKVDQYGNKLSNVAFNLCPATETYEKKSDECYSGTTDDKGELIIRSSSDPHAAPVKLSDLENHEHWILTEDTVPAGYRSAGDMHLYFDDGLLLSDNEWDTGAWSQPHVTVRTDATVHGYNNPDDTVKMNEGATYAVVLKKGADDNNTTWYPVSGSHTSGWEVSKVNVSVDDPDEEVGQAVLTAAQSYGDGHRFVVGSSGGYETTIDELPGDVNTYYYRLLQKDESADAALEDAKYTIGYFHFDTDANGNPIASNMQRVQANANGQIHNDNAFERIFSVTLNVPNIKNELKLRKTDAADNHILEGAEFTLYRYEDMTAAGEDPWKIPDSVSDCAHVNESDSGWSVCIANSDLATGNDGSLSVWSSGNILESGRYTLVETEAPSGYVNDATPIHIIVDDDGVHVDAGSATDNVTVETGIGSLVYSMRSFAAADEVDTTLHDVKVTPEASDNYGDLYVPVTEKGEPVSGDKKAAVYHYHYNDDPDESLDYVAETESPSSYTAVSGWSRLAVTQCQETHSDDSASNVNAYKQDLLDDPDTTDVDETQSLDALFTGDVTIHVTNSKSYKPTTASLSVQKTVAGSDLPADMPTFSFTLTLASASADNAVYEDINADTVFNEDGMTLTMADLKSGVSTKSFSVTFAKPGTYTFNVTEEKPSDGAPAGWSYDAGGARTVTVRVDEPGTGSSLSITSVEYDNTNAPSETDKKCTDAAAFTNTYVAVSSLPLTGGVLTPQNFVVVGVVVLLLAGGAWLLARRRLV